MTVHSKHNYDEDGRLQKAARKQQYTLFPAPIPFLNQELKDELGMSYKEVEEPAKSRYAELKVPTDYKDAKTVYWNAKTLKYNKGTAEEFLKWRATLLSFTKNYGYDQFPGKIMTLSQSMLEGRAQDTFMKQKAAMEDANLTKAAKEETQHTELEILNKCIHELSVTAFDTHTGWRDAMRGSVNI